MSLEGTIAEGTVCAVTDIVVWRTTREGLVALIEFFNSARATNQDGYVVQLVAEEYQPGEMRITGTLTSPELWEGKE